MNQKKLKKHLDLLLKTYDKSFLETDPLYFPRLYKTSKDQELVGLIASALAYGRVSQIKKSIQKVLDVMNPSPHAFTLSFNPAKKRENPFAGFLHRFNDASDIACLVFIAKQMIEQSGSIGTFFMEGFDKESKDLEVQDSGTLKKALSSFSRRALLLSHGSLYGKTKKIPKDAGVRFFFPSPEGGSACKRLCLYLRWMVRTGDDLDFGIWKGVSPASLVMPLDTHVARISKLLGLTTRKTPDWKMASEVTLALKKLVPEDPVRYDFAIARLGILNECPKKKDATKCRLCPIKSICVL
ncbi:MAG: TIGR02757 family protein [Deltaproteobacteria bacterium]|nr:TIGR02757 family protein [Deltaproteobacteria bacterium]